MGPLDHLYRLQNERVAVQQVLDSAIEAGDRLSADRLASELSNLDARIKVARLDTARLYTWEGSFTPEELAEYFRVVFDRGRIGEVDWLAVANSVFRLVGTGARLGR